MPQPNQLDERELLWLLFYYPFLIALTSLACVLLFRSLERAPNKSRPETVTQHIPLEQKRAAVVNPSDETVRGKIQPEPDSQSLNSRLYSILVFTTLDCCLLHTHAPLLIQHARLSPTDKFIAGYVLLISSAMFYGTMCYLQIICEKVKADAESLPAHSAASSDTTSALNTATTRDAEKVTAIERRTACESSKLVSVLDIVWALGVCSLFIPWGRLFFA